MDSWECGWAVHETASSGGRAGWCEDKVEIEFLLEILSWRGHRTPERRKVREAVRWICVKLRAEVFWKEI